MKIYQQQSGGITGDFVIRRGTPQDTSGCPVSKDYDSGNGQIVRGMIRDITPEEYGYSTRGALGACVNVGLVWDVPDTVFWEVAKGFSEFVLRRLQDI